MPTTSRPVDLDPFDHQFHEDPYPVYDLLREYQPVYRNERMDFWALTRHADVEAAFRDVDTYISGKGTLLEMMGDTDYGTLLGAEPMILFLDPPYHTQLRKLVAKAFTPRSVTRMEPYVRDLSERLCDQLQERGGGDLVQDFAALVPMHVIFEMIGVPEADRAEVRRWIDASVERTSEPPYLPASAIEAAGHNHAYTRDLIAQAAGCPADDLMGDLLRAEIVDDDGSPRRLDRGELTGFVGLLGGAGNETVTKLLSNTLILLQRHPDARRRASADVDTLAAAIEESLRFWSPAHYNGRTTTREVRLHGTVIPADAKVLLFMAAANRDPRRFAEPDRFDLDRADRDGHLAFGIGMHFCLGASLARMQARVSLEVFLRRFPAFDVDEDRLERVHAANVQGFEHAPFVTGL